MTCVYPDLGDWNGKKPVEAEAGMAAQAEELAWQTMLDLCAGRVTPCPVTVRPVYDKFGWMLTWLTAPAGVWASSGNPILRLPDDAILYTSILGGPLPNQHEVRLGRPVTKVDTVVIDGATVDPSLYRREDDAVIRTDGGVWPTVNDLEAPSGSTGVFEITYYRGYRPGSSFLWAAGILATEYYLSMTDGKKCRLPERVTSITRQGVTFQIPAKLFEDGRTGIREVDIVLRHYNPSGLRQQTVIASPDTIRRAPRRIG